MTEEEENKARGCDCLTRIEKELTAKLGTPVDLQLRGAMITDPKAESWEVFGDLPPLDYKYKEGKKIRTRHIGFAYCPFCGKKKD